MTAKSEGVKSQYPKLAGLLLVFASILAIVVLYALDITFFYEPKYLVGVTNTFFTAIIPLVVAFFAAKTYLRTGSLSVLLMGCGMLGFGLCAGTSGWLRELPGGANINVTIYNIGALLGSLCHFAGATISTLRKSYRWESGKQKPAAIPAYSAIILFAVLISFATVQHVIPPFFIQGYGPTAIRQIVLGLAVFLYALSSLFFMSGYLRTKSDFLYWYSLCLAMLAVGLFAFCIEKIVGCPIGWVGRSSNYVGAIFSLIAIHLAVRSGKSEGLPLEEVISGFFVDAEANYKTLVETASDAIISFDQENRVIFWNSSAEQIFGYTKAEAIGSPIFGMFINEEHAKTLKELIETTQGVSSQNTVEIVGRHKNGGLFPIELSAFARELPNGRVSTCILRDITERKQAEKKISHQIAITDGINRIFHEALAADTEEDLGRTCLAVAEELTQSKFGFIGEIGSDGFLHDIAISDPGWELCEMYGKAGHCRPLGDFKIHGLYGRVLLDGKSLLSNNPAEHPDSIGTPFGHPNLNAFLGVPLILDGRTIGMIALGNRDGGYSQADMEALEALSHGVVEVFARKRAEEALRESEAKFRSLFENMTEGVALHKMVYDESGTATDYRILTANPAFERHTGLRVEQCRGQLASVLYGTGDAPFMDVYAKSANSGEPYSFETYFPPMERYFHISVSSPEQGHFVTVFENITERKRAEETLRTTVRRFHKILSNIFSGILVVTEDDRIEFANQNFCDQFGIVEHPSDLIGLTAGEMLQKVLPAYADPEANSDGIREVLSRRCRIEDEEVLMRNGRVYARDHIPILVDGTPRGRMWQHRDITERKRTEEALRKSRDELELRVRERTAELLRAGEDLQKQAALLNLARDAIFVRGLDHTVKFWNDGAAQLYGFTSGEALGKVTQELLRTGFPEPIDRIAGQVLESGHWEGELRQTTSSGEEILVESLWALQRGKDGEALGFLEINRDVTARKVAEEALRSNMARLELVNAELQEFAHVASHDLQEPLRKIQTFCDMAMKRCGHVLDSTSQQYLDRVINSAGRMRQLLRDLLDFSRVATKPEPFKEIDLVKIAREAADVFEASVKDIGCKIEIKNMAAIEADETQMLRLFQNLIGNALKFRGASPLASRSTASLTGGGRARFSLKTTASGSNRSSPNSFSSLSRDCTAGANMMEPEWGLRYAAKSSSATVEASGPRVSRGKVRRS